jgi:hypothetical protein
MKLDDEIVELRNGGRCASRPVRGEATRLGLSGCRDSERKESLTAKLCAPRRGR